MTDAPMTDDADDLVGRLRAPLIEYYTRGSALPDQKNVRRLLAAAADEIERLAAENDGLRETFEPIIKSRPLFTTVWRDGYEHTYADISVPALVFLRARAALERRYGKSARRRRRHAMRASQVLRVPERSDRRLSPHQQIVCVRRRTRPACSPIARG